MQGAAIGGLGLLHAFVRDKHLILQHFSTHTAMITEARRQSGRAIQVHAMRRVLHLAARGRAWVTTTSHAMHHLLLTLLIQRRALVQLESLRRRMSCAAARRHLTQLISTAEPLPMTAAVPDLRMRCAHFRGAAGVRLTPTP